MAVFEDVRFIQYPAVIWSGQGPFSLGFYIHANNLPSSDNGIQDTWGNEKHVTVTLVYGNKVIYGPASLPMIAVQEWGEEWANVGIFNFAEIESFTGQVLQSTYNGTLTFSLWLEGATYYITAPGRKHLHPFAEEIVNSWPLQIQVPTIGASVDAPTVINSADPFSVKVAASYPFVPHDLAQWHGYIKTRCTAEDGSQKEYLLWESSDPEDIYYPNVYNVSIQKDDFNITDITGPISAPDRHFDIDIKIGFESSGTIVDTGVPWNRNSEVVIPWPVDVVQGTPDVHFVVGEFINPPLSVGENDKFPIKIVVENFWTHGTCYIECGTLELWRGNLVEYAKGVWQDEVNYKYLPGILGSDNHYTMTFNCGYIDSQGNKIQTDTVTRATYIVSTGMTLTISNLGGGKTVPATGVYSYEEGAIVTVRAIPNSGYEFQLWRGDVDPEHAQQDVFNLVMDSDKVLSARFVFVGNEGGGTGVLPYLAVAAAGVGAIALIGGRK